MTMREKMAQAMYELMRTRIPDGGEPMHAWENESRALHDDWLAVIDVGLDTLDDPTDGILEAVTQAITQDRPEHIGLSDEHLAIVAWRAGINAAKERR